MHSTLYRDLGRCIQAATVVPVVSSRTIAERFNRQHRNVLRDIRSEIEGLLKIEQTTRDYFIRS